MNIIQKLKWLILSGVTETIGEEPINRFERKATPIKTEPIPEMEPKADIALSQQAQALAQKAQTLTELYQARETFNGCPLKKTATHTVNGRGGSSPTILCVIEAADTEDDKSGIIMSGAVGQLLDKMLGAIGLDLNRNAYVTALVPWRPPGNRKPTEAEIACCLPFFNREIELLRPRCILIFGSGLSQILLGISALSKARGSWHAYQNIPVRVSVPPATLIKLPAQKKQAWEDLQAIQKKMEPN
ncbi:MAG: uracil-DNA glycosylase [Alphaproteobacteria bacterium]|nr:uracil-DNA glycosylase [Alphaproteobacteria bacterium]